MHSISQRISVSVNAPVVSRRTRPTRSTRVQCHSANPSPGHRAKADRIKKILDKARKHANEQCMLENNQHGCTIAWDAVWDLEKAYYSARDSADETDPLSEYCKLDPSADECREYDV